MISTTPKLFNLTYENIVNYYLDEETVMPEEILPDDKWVNGYRSDTEVKIGMSRATQEAKTREQASADGESRFLRTKAIRPIPLEERAVELNVAQKIHGKRRSKKNLEGLFEVLALGSHILKVTTTSTIKEAGKPVTCSDSQEQRFCEIRVATGAANSVKGVRGPQWTKIRRKTSGEANSKPR